MICPCKNLLPTDITYLEDGTKKCKRCGGTIVNKDLRNRVTEFNRRNNTDEDKSEEVERD